MGLNLLSKFLALDLRTVLETIHHIEDVLKLIFQSILRLLRLLKLFAIFSQSIYSHDASFIALVMKERMVTDVKL